MKFSVRASYPETVKYNWFEAIEAWFHSQLLLDGLKLKNLFGEK